MSSLHPCGSCLRHIRRDGPACPFCAAPVDPVAPRPVLAALRRPLTRSAILFAGAALLAPGCGSSSQRTTSSESTSSSGSDDTETVGTDSERPSGGLEAPPPAVTATPSPSPADPAEGGSPAPMYGTPN